MSNIVRITRHSALKEAAEILLKAQSRSFPSEIIVAFATTGHAWATLALALDDDDSIDVDRDSLEPVKLEYGPVTSVTK